ncbi:HAD family hydrolase [Sediminispirochaeta smaragdinae]|uniref:phosphoglycolate phosphatase n=1 Tax=Sediminispirochaeta smaragdinae (strain DSM 11293 / JCM 15392 / SEBR 4228) TaxID=573413 RepID=E1R1W9_SEDSS|nr:HAD family hydrolase [Sediminispirochaeta smaragdinae]ADK81495.1 HAD-superfamily hydrolase, subfamily IA, variant 3 [Sediminispirochaeta smaragdinae DSM 11293]
MNIRAIFFDLDGTLLDTMPDIVSALDGALARNGFPRHPTEAYPGFVGSGLREAGRRAMPAEKRGDGRLVERLYHDILDIYREHPVEKTRMYPGIERLLRQLSQSKLKLAIITNKDLEIASSVIDQRLPSELFDAVVGVDRNTPPKPDPSGSLSASKRLSVVPEQVLLVGDSDVDMATARAAGFDALAVSWGYRSLGQLQAAGAPRIVFSPEEILKIVEVVS